MEKKLILFHFFERKEVMEKTEAEIDALVLEAQNGEKEAIGDLYDYFLESIYRFLYFRVSHEAEAEDLTEEVFFKMLKNLKKYEKRSDMPFSAWLFRIAKNALVDYYRKKITPEELSEEIRDERIKIESETEEKIDRKRLLSAIKKLPKAQGESLILRFFSDRSNAEIAAVLGKSETAVRILQSRGLRKLKDIIEQ